MAASLDFVAFTLVPICVMGGMIGYISVATYRLDDKRPVLLVALLALMTAHQLTEIVQFSAGAYYRTTSPPAELFETVANLLASVASYFVLQQIAELRTTRTELEASNAALKERSSMVSVLNRVLRHNVRNDVNVIAGRAASVRNDVAEDQLCRELKTIEETAWRLASISNRTQRIRQLLTEDATSQTTFQLPDRLERHLKRVRTGASDATITLTSPNGPELVVEGPSMLPIAVADVVEQIVASNGGSVDIEITVSREPAESGVEWVLIVIDDDGDGLPDLDVQAIEGGEETPLRHAEGLSVWCLEWAVERAGGELDTQPDGATVEIRLPRIDGPDK